MKGRQAREEKKQNKNPIHLRVESARLFTEQPQHRGAQDEVATGQAKPGT